MKIRRVRANGRKRAFEVRAGSRTMDFPYAKAAPRPTSRDRVAEVTVDPELGREGFTYFLESGRQGSVHIEQVLEYHRDPAYLRDLLLYELTLEARRRLESSALSKREVTRRLGTSASQLDRLLDPANHRKSIDRVLSLLQVLGCEVDLVVRSRAPGGRLRPTAR